MGTLFTSGFHWKRWFFIEDCQLSTCGSFPWAIYSSVSSKKDPPALIQAWMLVLWRQNWGTWGEDVDFLSIPLISLCCSFSSLHPCPILCLMPLISEWSCGHSARRIDWKSIGVCSHRLESCQLWRFSP